MSKLTDSLAECEQATATFLGKGAAKRLSHWREHVASEGALVDYVKKLLRGARNSNGWELEANNALSLERIVLNRCPELFDEDDKEQARRTLNLHGK